MLRSTLRLFSTKKPKVGIPVVDVKSVEGKRADPTPLRPVAVEIFERNSNADIIKHPEIQPESMLHQDPLYTPIANPNLGFGIKGELKAPLHYPEFDQSTPPLEQYNGLSLGSSWSYAEFEDTSTAPIGDYPRDIPMQWTQLKDPFKYWDQQGRRNYGEILHDQDNFTDWLGIGPEISWKEPLKATVQVGMVIALMGFAVAYWNPEDHLWFAEKDFPYDGLRVELGGDPNDESDDWMKANTYKI